MKILSLIVAVFIFNILSAKVHFTPINYGGFQDSVVLKAKRLQHLYLLSTSSSEVANNKYKQQFFDEFPNNFKELREIYGYNHGKLGVLYSESENHIYNLFNNLTCIKDTLYYRKIISIAVGGHWEGDAINYFQYGLRKRVLSNLDLTLNILKNMNDTRIRSFWYFYFDEVHPKMQIPDFLQKLKSINKRIYDLIVEAHDEVLKHSKE